jgi:hypothetical protein
MSAMGLPGFTADASLYRATAHYHAADALGPNSGVSPQTCGTVGQLCAKDSDCCSGSCENKHCLCRSIDRSCESDSECCTGWCSEKTGQCDCLYRRGG